MKRLQMIAMSMLAFALLGSAAQAQILNTLIGFDEDEFGLSGSARILAGASGGNTELFSLAGGGRMQWQSPDDRIRLIVDGKRKSSNGKRIEEAISAHLRHNHRLLPRLRSVAFAQAQQNLFQRLRERYLLGIGARIEILETERIGIGTGITPMLEFEKIEGDSGLDRDLRLSTFVLVGGHVSDRIKLSLTAFYQPLANRISDARAIASAAMESEIVGPLSFVWSGNFQYDSEPPDRVETTDWSFETGLAVSF